MRRPFALLAAVLVLAGAAACGGDDETNDAADEGSTGTTLPAGLQAQVASYDLAVGAPGRFIVGVYDEAEGPVGYGTISLNFVFVGEKRAGTPVQGPKGNGTYVPLPGSPPAPGDAAQAQYLPKDERGVYASEIAFDKAGIWGVQVSTELDGKRQSAEAAFTVLPKHEVPAPGDDAPRTENLTVDSPGAAPTAVDSRAQEGTEIPDQDLHSTTVAAALAKGRPVLLVVSTPTYCISMFCGPITETIAEMAKTYGDRASFIHIEVWKDFEGKALNDAAKEWIARGNNINEPWVFLIGGDGKIIARWDNVASPVEIEPMLKELPVIAG